MRRRPPLRPQALDWGWGQGAGSALFRNFTRLARIQCMQCGVTQRMPCTWRREAWHEGGPAMAPRVMGGLALDPLVAH